MKRHVQARRRLTTSSSRRRASSVPKRLGHGIRRLITRSTTPRKPSTTSAASVIDPPTLWPSWRKKKAAGLVRTATTVATRASRRSCDARAIDSSPERSMVVGVTSAVAMAPSQCRCVPAYSLYTLVPDLDFSQEEADRASRYHRPLYLLFAVRLVLGAALYAVLAWTWVGDRLWSVAHGLGWAGSAALWAVLVVLVSALVGLPLDTWRLRYERRWGFSRETNRGWAVDKLKGGAIGLSLTTAVWVAVVALGRALPGWWPLPAAA